MVNPIQGEADRNAASPINSSDSRCPHKSEQKVDEIAKPAISQADNSALSSSSLDNHNAKVTAESQSNEKAQTVDTFAQQTWQRSSSSSSSLSYGSVDLSLDAANQPPQAPAQLPTVAVWRSNSQPAHSSALSSSSSSLLTSSSSAAISSGSSSSSSSSSATSSSSLPAETPMVRRPEKSNLIDEKDKQAWISEHPEGEIREAASTLVNAIRHVSQEEFENSLRGTLKEFTAVINGTAFVAVIEKGKSNEWVTGLAEEMLELSAEKITSGQVESQGIEGKKIVFFDDAVYSGEQMARNIRNVLAGICTKHLREHPETLSVPLPQIVVACPYITGFGLEKLQELSKITVNVGRKKGTAIEPDITILAHKKIPNVAEAIEARLEQEGAGDRLKSVLDTLWTAYWSEEKKIDAKSTQEHPGKRAPVPGSPASSKWSQLGYPRERLSLLASSSSAPPPDQSTETFQAQPPTPRPSSSSAYPPAAHSPTSTAPRGLAERLKLQESNYAQKTMELAKSTDKQVANRNGPYSRGALYFDHKIADAYSFPEALAEGQVVDTKGNPVATKPLIHKTTPPYYPN